MIKQLMITTLAVLTLLKSGISFAGSTLSGSTLDEERHGPAEMYGPFKVLKGFKTGTLIIPAEKVEGSPSNWASRRLVGNLCGSTDS